MSNSTNIYIKNSEFQNTIISVQSPTKKDEQGKETGGMAMSYPLRDLDIECRFVDSPKFGRTVSTQFIGTDNPSENAYAVITQSTGRQPFKLKTEFYVFGNVGSNDKERFQYYHQQKSFLIDLLNSYDVFKIENPLLKEAFSNIRNVSYDELRWTITGNEITPKDVIESNHRPVPMGSIETTFIEVTLRDISENIKIEKKRQTVRFSKKVDLLKGKYGIKDGSVIKYKVMPGDTLNRVVAKYATGSKARKRLRDKIINYPKNSILKRKSAIRYKRSLRGYYLLKYKILYIPQ